MRLPLGAAVLLALVVFLWTGAPAHAARSLEQVSGASPAGSYTDFGGVSSNGRHAVFISSKRLDPADTDDSVDVYDRADGVTTLVSIGPAGGNGPSPASFDLVSQNGATIIFETSEQLTADDTDTARDVYARAGETTTLVSTGPSPGASLDAFYGGGSIDGQKIFFGTNGSLDASDTDTSFDVYMRAGGATTLMTTGPNGGSGVFPAEFSGVSADGVRMFFTTSEQLVSADTDTTVDVYERSGGTTTLVSIGPDGGNGDFPVTYDGSSGDGTKVFFSTEESLVSADLGGEDIYRRSGGTTSIASNPAFSAIENFVGISGDGNHAYYQTTSRQTAADVDAFIDVYDSNNGSISLVSPGTRNNLGATNAYFLGASSTGSHVFIRLEEPLVAADSDNTQDIYDISGGTASLVSTGTAGGNASVSAIYAGASKDGTRVFFETYESLVPADTDATIDVYERTAGETTLLSGGSGAIDARFRAASPDGSRVFVRTGEALLAGDTDAVNDIYSADVPGQVVIVKNAVPDDPQDFTFTIGGGLSLGLAAPPGQTTFQLDDDADPALSNTQTFTDVPPGSSYSVAETPIAGWDTSSATCDNNSPVTGIRVDAGATTTCTWTNDKRGRIVIALDSQPDAPQDFTFTAGGGLAPTSFQLDDDADPTLSNTQSFENLVPAAGYSVAESVPGTWQLTDSTCSDGSPVSNIDVSKGETVTCTFTNVKRGKIVVVKDAQPDDPQDFAFTAGGGLSPTSFSLDDDADGTLLNSQTFSNLAPGSGYSVAETAVPGWDQSSATCDNGSPVTNITVAVGQTVTCTFVNRNRGTIVLVEDSQPNDAQDFSYTAGGGLSPTSFSLDDDSDGTLSNTRSFSNLLPASGYSLAQGAAPSGWDLSSSTCSDGSTPANIGVSAGETVTCTFVNKKRGSLVVVKDSVPNDGQNFTFTPGGGLSPSTTFQLDDDNNPQLPNSQTFTNVQAKSGYSISEGSVSGWYQASATCSDGSAVTNIDIAGGENVTCTFTNNKVARITVVLDSQPDDAQDFAYTTTGLGGPGSFTLDDDTNPANSNTKVFDNLTTGSGYALAQAGVAGWDLASATCTDGSPVTNIDLSAGEQITCTFVNKKRGSLTIVKDAQPNDAQDFSFTTGGALSPASFQLDDDADAALPTTQTFASVPAAAGYTVSEAATAGWTASSSCSDGSPVTNIDVGPAENVTCTFTNKRNGTVVVVKDAQPDDSQDFAFTAGGGLSPASFSLDDDSDGTLSNTRTFSNVAPKAGYTLSETVPSGWDQSSATCSDGSPVSNVDVAPNETVTCTFTNRKRGKIVLVEDSLPDDPQDFAFAAAGGLSPTSFSLDDDADPTLSNTLTFTVAPASGYSISETVPTGWDQTGATCDNGNALTNITVAAGQTVTCTASNRKRGKVVVVKDAVPNDAQDFAFTAGGGLSPASFSLDDDSDPTLSNTQTFSNVVPGSGYSLAETVPAGWDQTSASCSDGSAAAAIDVSPGETVTCTWVNTKRAQLTLVKDAQPNAPADFAFTAGGGLSPSSFLLDDDSDPTLSNTRTFTDVAPGTYSLSEGGMAAWDLTSATCTDASPTSAIVLSPGEQVTCTFTNVRRGNLTVVESSTPSDAQDFAFTAGPGLSPASFSLDDDADPTLANTRTFSNISAGTYSLAETVPSGWDLSSATCDNGNAVTSIAIAPAGNVTCTFSNRKRGRIVVTEDSQPNDPQNFSFTAGGGLSPAGFSLDDDADPALSNTRSFDDLTPGSGYSLAETVPSGWDLAAASCDDGSAISNIDVSPGEVVTCTWTNTRRGKVVAVKNAIPDDPRDFSFTAGGGLSPASFSLDDDSDATLSNTRTFDDVLPGSGYSLAETVPSGWDQTSATCSDGSATSNIDVAPGETVTCTWANTKRAQLTITKDAQPNDALDFDFTTGGGLSPASFSLDDDSDPTLAATRDFTDVAPGTYSVSEGSSAGWDLASATCDDGSPVSAIALAPGEHVTCTWTNRKRSNLVVVESSTPDDPQDFSFTAGGGLSPASFQLDDDSDPALADTRTFAGIQSGTYSVSETLPGGWDLTGASCDDGSPASAIDIAPGETVTCTWSNRKRGNVIVSENSQPNDPQDFSFTAGGGLSPASFQLDDDSDPTLASARTFTHVTPGSGYSIDETLPVGWDLISATCNDGSPISDIDVAPGETVSCTWTNRKRGKIVAVKDAVPNAPRDFSFTAGGGLSPATFQLDDDSDPGLSNTQTFDNLAQGSGYSLDETVPSGWDQTSASCDDGSPVSNIAVSAGETVTCTWVNTKRAQLTIVKDAQPDGARDFSFTAGGGLSPSSFDLDDDSDPTLERSQTFPDVPPGTYAVSEGAVPGWDIASATCDDGSPVSAIDLAPAEQVTCTWTNRQRSNLVVVESSTPNSPQDFSFTAGGGLAPGSFSLDDDSDPTLSNTRTFAGIQSGTYSISETVPGGWDLTSVTCDDGSPASSIDVNPGETVTCTWSNRKRGQIVVNEDSQPNDPQDFAFTAGGGLSPASFSLDDDSDGTLASSRTFTNVQAGAYTIAETVPGGWDQTSATCDDGSPVASIDVGPGETVTCTWTNRKRGKIVVVKDAQPNDAQDFDFTAGGGLSPASFSLDDDSDGTLSNTRTFANVVPGSGYGVAETEPAGWDQTSATCDDGSSPSDIGVSAGETVTCTWVNAKRAQLTVVKDAQPNAAQDFDFTTGGGLSPASFSLDDDSDPTLSSSRTFTGIVPGTYSVDEAATDGWDLTSATCSDGSAISAIQLSAGEDVTCTFTNRGRGQLTVIDNSVPDDPQDFSFSAGGGLSPTSFSLDDDSDPTLANTRTFASIQPGTYSIAETVPSGWGLSGATCDDGSPVSSIAVGPGESVTCTFTNNRNGKIVAVKDAQPNDPQDFSFTAGGGLSPASFSLDDDSDPALSNTRAFSDLTPGSGYSLSESVPAGWDQTGASCDDGSPPANISVSPGETVTCTWTNQKRGKIVVVKDAQPNDAQDFPFTAGGGLSPASFSLDDDSDSTLSNTRTFSNVLPQDGYSLAENVPATWLQDSATCDDGSLVTDIGVGVAETVTCTFVNVRGYPRPKGASPLRVSFVPTFNPCTAPDTSHGPPLGSQSCRPPALLSGSLAIGSPDANGKAANMTGFLVAHTIAGNTSTTADEADVRLDVALSDLRKKSDLTDYTGAVSIVTTVRSTDRYSGAGLDEPATVADFPFSVTMPCTATSSSTTGGTCSLTTTVDAVTPGSILESKRTVWALGDVQVFDGGPDGNPATAGNTLFARQGVFVP